MSRTRCLSSAERTIIRDALYMAALHHLSRRDWYIELGTRGLAEQHDLLRKQNLELWQLLDGADLDAHLPAPLTIDQA
jgi:hypothetical protein